MKMKKRSEIPFGRFFSLFMERIRLRRSGRRRLCSIPVACQDISPAALLAIKEQELRELGGVTFDADEFILPPTAAAMSYDLCVILGNALDNAIRACKEMKEHKEDSQITLTASVTGSSLLITLPSS